MVIKISEIEKFSRSAKYAKIKDEVKATKAKRSELFPDFSEATVDKMADAWTESVIQRHNSRLAYNAAYQRDLRTIKRLGLNCTVAVYRAGKQGETK